MHIRGRIVTDRNATHEKRMKTSMHVRGRIVMDRNVTDKKRICVGRALNSDGAYIVHSA